jgi:hypothetical protein
MRVLVVPSSKFTQKTGDEIQEWLSSLVPDIQFEVAAVDKITPEISGKRPLLRNVPT